MHPRNRYRAAPPVFEALASAHPALQQYFDAGNGNSFDLQKPGATEELVKALLRVDFKIESYSGVPAGYLVPSVTRSLNYLHFIEDLLSEAVEKEVLQPDAKIRGLDVGVGASCIFPLLACALHEDWTMVGIDLCESALTCAQENAKQFENRITLLLGDGLALNIKKLGRFDFLMCNPPFFSTALSEKEEEEHRRFGGTALERSCEGGEVGFVSKLVEQSACLCDEFVWFTSMVGRKESIQPLLALLHQVCNESRNQARVETIRVYRLEQGHTFRWVLAWSFNARLGRDKSCWGRECEVNNLDAGGKETLEGRVHAALGALRNYTVATGICATPAYRFRLRVVVLSKSRFRVDTLDLFERSNDQGAGAKAARSAQNKVEQDIMRTSRKWRKRMGH